MAIIKAYTDLSQSKTLSKILPLESADMYYDRYGTPSFIDEYVSYRDIKNDKYQHLIPCWSLSVLLSVLPKVINNETLFIETSPALWHIGYRDVYIARADNPVDACVTMIEKLHKQMIYDFNNN